MLVCWTAVVGNWLVVCTTGSDDAAILKEVQNVLLVLFCALGCHMILIVEGVWNGTLFVLVSLFLLKM